MPGRSYVEGWRRSFKILAQRPMGRAMRGLRRTRLLGDERGSFLIEVMVTAGIVLVVGLGVLAMVDRTSELSGQQRTQAVAGNVAQVELDTVKALPLSQLSNLRSTSSRTVGGVAYAITTRADWVNDTTMAPNCSTPGATADYLRVRTTVTYPGIRARRPAVLDTLVSPGVRAFDSNQGSLAVLITDRAGTPVSGLPIALTGPATNLTEPTNANGCVLWGYLKAVSGYSVSFSRTDWVNPNGTSAGGGPVSVVGDETINAAYQFDHGGAIRANFTTKRAGVPMPTKPTIVRVENSTGAGFLRDYSVGASSLDTTASGRLFPFANPYAVYADNCPSAKPPTATSVALTPGSTVQAADVQLPALNITVKDDGGDVANATVTVTTPCGNTYTRQTDSAGLIDDPGFPYATAGMTVCASKGGRKRVLSNQANTSFDGVDMTLNIGSSGSSGNCP
jgi:hypothetical protein